MHISPDDIEFARNVARKAGRQVLWNDREEVEAVGLLGLVEAASRWDPAGGATLRVFAYRRIIGAVVDERRKRVGIRRRDGRRYLFQVLDDPRELLPKIADPVEGRVEATADLRAVVRAIGRIDDRREREVLLRHLRGATQGGAGQRVGASKSWMCRMEARARASLARELREAA